jgi:choline dehydrogenase
MYAPDMEGPPDGFTLMAGSIRPASRGYLQITSAELADELIIDPNYLEQPADLEILSASLQQCRAILEQSALADWRDRELYPGPQVRTRAQIEEYIRSQVITYHHQVGTCKMGVDAQAVVDPELRVYGIRGLRVAGASVMPLVPGGNTNAPAIMIGEKAADLLAGARRA